MTSSRTSAKTVRSFLAIGLGVAAAALGATAPASAQPAPVAAPHAGYTGSAQESANSKAFFDAVLKSVAEQRAANPSLQAVTVYYNASQAPSFRSQISSSTSIWNS
ncbi:snapalysin family zinc-dependent metalloprotease, partial [Streptomyces sp. SID4982]|uniref:snapalysin family zinc-dependent metalloprotease n=2 Tax=Streptomyces TaxID=1883 RepID=UPI00136E0FF4